MIPRSDEPLSDKTTHRLDYVPKPLVPPQRREQEPYKPSLEPLDDTTNYRLDYIPKKACPTEPCLPLPICECPARQWNLPPIERPKANSYKPPDAPFDGLPTYKVDYVPKCDSRRSPMKPRQELSLPDLPLDSATNYKSDYVPHPLQKREGLKKDFYFKSRAPFNDLTTFKADYTLKDFCAPQLCRPNDALTGSTEPLSTTTTHRVDYVPRQLTPPTRYHPDEYKKPDAPMEKATTYKQDYLVLPLCKPEPITIPECPKCPAPFDGNTIYKSEYKPWDVPSQIVKPLNPYCPPTVPMESLSTNKADYGPKQPCRVQPVKPFINPLICGDFDDQTNYKIDYAAKYIDWHCPAAYLTKEHISRDGYAFEATDPCGHEHYKLVGEATKA
ncbi:hypothetical protein Aperf_G00000030278 [Anoplocephala perfoliata]